MITYSANQRRSLRFTGSDWVEEVLAASGVEVDQTNFEAISGAEVQAALDSIDNALAGITYSTTSGVVAIDDVVNVSGVTSESVGDLEVITLASGSNSSVKFAFTVPAQPAQPVILRLACIGRSAAVSGNVKFDLEYNLFDSGEDVTPATAFAYSGTATQSFVAADNETVKLVNISIPTANFSDAGSAPFIASCKLTRDVSVANNYAANISVAQIYADNVPGGIIGNQAGYVGGNLEVTGDLRVQNHLILQDAVIPASGTDTGEAGTLVIDDDFIYAATGTNSWKRVPISQF